MVDWIFNIGCLSKVVEGKRGSQDDLDGRVHLKRYDEEGN